jgi:hypothetical protein
MILRHRSPPYRRVTVPNHKVLFNCVSRTIIARQGFFEEMQHMLSARSGP